MSLPLTCVVIAVVGVVVLGIARAVLAVAAIVWDVFGGEQ